MKRGATDQIHGAQASKRSRLDNGFFSDEGLPTGSLDSKEDLDDDSEYSEAESHEDDETISNHPTVTPSTPISPSRKFPSDLKTIQCTHPGCNKTFNRPARLAAHLRSHSNERPFRCTYADCDKAYIEEKHLRQHIKGSHTHERNHTCSEPGCGKSFLTATRLRRHQAVHEGQERFRCRDFPPCDRSFRKHQTLQRHIRSDHLKLSAFACSHMSAETGLTCGASFDTSNALKRHTEREHGSLRFWCDECSKLNGEDGLPLRTGFPTSALLQAHIKKAHISCMFCDQTFTTRTDLETHIETGHSKPSSTDRKGVACTHPGCTKTFTKKSNMKAHLRSVHEGVRFVCGQVDFSATQDLATWPQSQGCGHGFVTKGNLEDHVRHVHMGLKRPEPAKKQRGMGEDNEADALAELLGVSGNPRQTIPCTISGCLMRFSQNHELQAHLLQHDDQVGQDGVTAPGFTQSESVTQAASGGNAAFMLNWGDDDDFAGEEFWIGANSGVGTPAAGLDEEWFRDEAEMRELIGVEGLADLIDPALHQS